MPIMDSPSNTLDRVCCGHQPHGVVEPPHREPSTQAPFTPQLQSGPFALGLLPAGLLRILLLNTMSSLSQLIPCVDGAYPEM